MLAIDEDLTFFLGGGFKVEKRILAFRIRYQYLEIAFIIF